MTRYSRPLYMHEVCAGLVGANENTRRAWLAWHNRARVSMKKGNNHKTRHACARTLHHESWFINFVAITAATTGAAITPSRPPSPSPPPPPGSNIGPYLALVFPPNGTVFLLTACFRGRARFQGSEQKSEEYHIPGNYYCSMIIFRLVSFININIL